MRARFGRYLLCCLAAAALAATASAQTRYTTVVIDPGHGGFDRGGIPGQRVPEKIMTLDVSLRLKPLLEKAGYRVVMTRDADVFIPLGERVAMARVPPSPIHIPTRFLSVFISIPPLAVELTGSRHTFTVPKARPSPLAFTPLWSGGRLRKIAESDVAAILFCGKQQFRPC